MPESQWPVDGTRTAGEPTANGTRPTALDPLRTDELVSGSGSVRRFDGGVCQYGVKVDHRLRRVTFTLNCDQCCGGASLNVTMEDVDLGGEPVRIGRGLRVTTSSTAEYHRLCRAVFIDGQIQVFKQIGRLVRLTGVGHSETRRPQAHP